MKPLPFDEVFKQDKFCETIEINGKTYLFTILRVDPTTLPKGYFKYDLRDEFDGEICQIKEYVLVNHWGAIVGPYQLPLDEEGCYYPTENDINYDITEVNKYLEENQHD